MNAGLLYFRTARVHRYGSRLSSTSLLLYLSTSSVSSVLIIDDEPGIRFALRRWFERHRWSVEEAGDGEDALVRIQERSDDGVDAFDLVVCDVNLPRRSGASLLGVLRVERPATASRVILSTGDDVGDAAPGSLLHVYPHILQKPFDLSTLKELVARVARPGNESAPDAG